LWDFSLGPDNGQK